METFLEVVMGISILLLIASFVAAGVFKVIPDDGCGCFMAGAFVVGGLGLLGSVAVGTHIEQAEVDKPEPIPVEFRGSWAGEMRAKHPGPYRVPRFDIRLHLREAEDKSTAKVMNGKCVYLLYVVASEPKAMKLDLMPLEDGPNGGPKHPEECPYDRYSSNLEMRMVGQNRIDASIGSDSAILIRYTP